MIGYSDTQSDPIMAFGPISFNREGEVLFSFNASVYVGAGMSFNLSYNVIELFVRLFD